MADAPITTPDRPASSVPVNPPTPGGKPPDPLGEYSRFTQTLVNGWRAITRQVTFGGVGVPWVILWGFALLVLAGLASSNEGAALMFAGILLLGAILRYVVQGA